jgi:hypothetical protein
MLGLVDYESSDSENGDVINKSLLNSEKSEQIERATRTLPFPAKGRVEGSANQKKAKQVLRMTSILPPEIQKLLESGVPDDDDVNDALPISRKRADGARAADSHPPREQHALFSLLPKPSQEKVYIRPSNAPLEKAKEPAMTSNSTPCSDKPELEETERSDDDDSDDDDPSEDGPRSGYFSFQARSDNSEQRAPSWLADYSSEADLEPKSVEYSDVQVDGAKSAPVESISTPSHLEPEVLLMQRHSLDIWDIHFVRCAQVVGKAKRMRDRDLERSLVAGDLNALDDEKSELLYQLDTTNWNPHLHGADVTKQEVRTIFTKK